MMEKQHEIQARLLLAFEVVLGQRDTLTNDQMKLLGVPLTASTFVDVKRHCVRLIVGAIIAGGYR